MVRPILPDERAAGASHGSAGFTLPMPAGLRIQDVLAFHGRDGQSVSERVEGSRLHKAFMCEGRASVLTLAFREQAVEASLTGPTGPAAMARARDAALRLLGSRWRFSDGSDSTRARMAPKHSGSWPPSRPIAASPPSTCGPA
ncbi:MAG: hypothetical protein Q8K67_11000 [Geothrix sp.]|nr:hypothetical protein [Geothrix sp.]